MKYVRWKQYGFTHIIPEGGNKTFCGNDFRHYGNFRIGYVYPALEKAGLRKGDPDPRVLAPSFEDDGKRPVCGACAKAKAKIDAEKAANWCNCGTKTPQPEYHAFDCPAFRGGI